MYPFEIIYPFNIIVSLWDQCVHSICPTVSVGFADSVSGQWLNNCVAQDANFNDEDDDLDILPPLPSLATRLKSPLNPTSGTIATGWVT